MRVCVRVHGAVSAHRNFGMMSMDQVSIVNGTPNQIPILINVKSMESSSKLLGKQQLRRVVLVV